MSARVRRSGLARTRIGPPWRNPGHAPLRRAIPLIRGTEREERIRADPSARPKTGASMALALALWTTRKAARAIASLLSSRATERSEGDPGPSKHRHERPCTAEPHHIVERLPRIRGDDNERPERLAPGSPLSRGRTEKDSAGEERSKSEP